MPDIFDQLYDVILERKNNPPEERSYVVKLLDGALVILQYLELLGIGVVGGAEVDSVILLRHVERPVVGRRRRPIDIDGIAIAILPTLLLAHRRLVEEGVGSQPR